MVRLKFNNEVTKVAIHVVLYQPEIPANTGNIARTCAATDTKLHLIKPLGFSTDDKMLKRAGLDYWHHVNITYYDSIDEFFAKNENGEFYYIETFGEKPHSAFDYSDVNKDYYFMFGKETTGLPKDLLINNKDYFLRIPMNDNVRSLNLSNTAAILVYEALRQQGFPNLK
ncbi:tRNA (uridine(34)/cytosine(34)/5-carboxymethylaminomethyluridine(34)-2'-O)-methyltransferase TrmL [Bacillus sporothermodurans]|uniref:Putative tRNA (cytidine(34)-2'-O)-methyltransferase n=1 Tax=Heyndrickxia sporothermodurans TaxID=46224 RepID=A0AB37HJP1_9BACI|nr:tRNA (uridine(34)/cytosine(34)/5-carboxymethylaminomethyluridine(34)-2'-O)-methyltransferase TrmL [Heyndrickxia sporothermodurans]MBL5768355.1 tRNA (uridine(34)/cytosine(34)/5-carboxymethylaminomethyluridine(34)-2'-O)-methyltransferase TrmL [Heyndrickxia sporothermodurans]MBL5771995.1 tRNA (uridine(34)/cytosine(34)/5-carboxymethylaminomethyluridine(34)-2'-O)-methyltransferase TrmL [Heyndrickxia sporothermodurans]MBL5775602.1 tRNA (uridine(34)/cytosine(34)/5-carboxymethylaminomethyluridine(34)